jgi:STE24 endopeptidase
VNEDRATRYHRLKRRAVVLSLAWSAVLFTALLVTGASLQLRETAERTASAIGRSSPAFLVILYVAGLILLHQAGSFIIALYGGFIVEHRYGLSNERFSSWLWEQAKALGLGLVLVQRRRA